MKFLAAKKFFLFQGNILVLCVHAVAVCWMWWIVFLLWKCVSIVSYMWTKCLFGTRTHCSPAACHRKTSIWFQSTCLAQNYFFQHVRHTHPWIILNFHKICWKVTNHCLDKWFWNGRHVMIFKYMKRDDEWKE